jgi:glycyl-tRNA synthetase beta chain
VERVQFYLRDHLKFRFDIVLAVTASSSDDVSDARDRAEALSVVVGKPEFRVIAVAFKRMHNIIRQAKEKNIVPAKDLNKSLFNDAERDLYKEMEPIGALFQQSREAHRYADALNALVELAPRIDSFFENVMVMADDPDLRGNRLRLLNEIGRSFSGIAHFSEIVTEGKESKESSKQ